MEKNKLVSIILPVYNGGRYLSDAIDSITSQSYGDFELIIADDGSTDGTRLIIEKKAAEDSRIKPYFNSNSGLIYTLNFLLDKCIGEYIARMDADDICDPNRIREQVKFLNENSSISACGTQVKYIGSASGISNIATDSEKCMLKAKFSTPIYHPTAMFRNYGLKYDSSYIHAEDYKFWTDFIKVGNIANIDIPLLQYRIHSEQVSRKYNVIQAINQLKISFEQISASCEFSMDNYCQAIKCFIETEEFDVLSRKNPKLILKYISYNLGFCGFLGFITYLCIIKKLRQRSIKLTLKQLLRTIKWSFCLTKLNTKV